MKIYHNPRCSKSRQTLQLLRDNGQEPEIVEYLKESLSAQDLAKLIKKLKISPEQLIRKGESIFKEQYKGQDLNDADWIQAMVDNPVLIERPIVEAGTRAVLGRPPENVLALLKK